jgi:hypothetical protein
LLGKAGRAVEAVDSKARRGFTARACFSCVPIRNRGSATPASGDRNLVQAVHQRVPLRRFQNEGQLPAGWTDETAGLQVDRQGETRLLRSQCEQLPDALLREIDRKQAILQGVGEEDVLERFGCPEASVRQGPLEGARAHA